MYDSNCLDSENRTTNSTLSIPVFKINRIAFTKNQKVRISVTCPPLYNIDNSNNNITINSTAYTIDNGFYDGIESLLNEINLQISGTGVLLTYSSVSSLITATSSSVFTLSKSLLLGFTSNKTGSSSYTADQAFSLNKNTICLCSNLSSLFSQINLNKQPESYHPRNYLFSFLNSAVNSYNYIQSEYMTVNNNIMFDELTFYFGTTGTTPTIIDNIVFNWSVILEVIQ